MKSAESIAKEIASKVMKGITDKDEVKITSKIIKDFLSKSASSLLRKKLGSDIDVQFGDIIITNGDVKAHVELSVSADINSDELIKLLDNINVE